MESPKQNSHLKYPVHSIYSITIFYENKSIEPSVREYVELITAELASLDSSFGTMRTSGVLQSKLFIKKPKRS